MLRAAAALGRTAELAARARSARIDVTSAFAKARASGAREGATLLLGAQQATLFGLFVAVGRASSARAAKLTRGGRAREAAAAAEAARRARFCGRAALRVAVSSIAFDRTLLRIAGRVAAASAARGVASLARARHLAIAAVAGHAALGGVTLHRAVAAVAGQRARLVRRAVHRTPPLGALRVEEPSVEAIRVPTRGVGQWAAVGEDRRGVDLGPPGVARLTGVTGVFIEGLITDPPASNRQRHRDDGERPASATPLRSTAHWLSL